MIYNGNNIVLETNFLWYKLF